MTRRGLRSRHPARSWWPPAPRPRRPAGRRADAGPVDDDEHPGSGLLDVLVPMFEQADRLLREDDLGRDGPGAGPRRARRGRRHARPRARPREEVRRGGQDAEPPTRHVQRLHRRSARRTIRRGVKGFTAAEALRRIAGRGARSCRAATSRAPTCSSRRSGNRPASSRRRAWYIESGQGMGADAPHRERAEGVRADRPGHLPAFQKRVDLPILVEKDRPLLNIYSRHGGQSGQRAPGQRRRRERPSPTSCCRPPRRRSSRTFGVDKYGQPLFVPIAGQREEEVGG